MATSVVQDAFAFPLSFAQQRLWFLDQFERESAAYNLPSAVRMKGRLDTAAFERALDEITRRHEVLRTTFQVVDGEPAQIVKPHSPFALTVEDIQHLPEQDREREALRLVAEEARRPFDLARSPVIRAKLLRLDRNDHVFLLTMHHIISDEWSLAIFIRELCRLYEAYSLGKSSPLPDLPVQYADFAIWQRDWLKGEVLQRQLDYWKRELGARPPVLELPTDRPRPPVAAFQGATVLFTLPESLAEKIELLGKREDCTLFMTLLAAFQTLLHRYSGQQEIITGSPVANRSKAQVRDVMGLLVNSLVLKADFSGDPTFSELLSRVRKTTLGAYDHADIPFEKLVDSLQPERDTSRSPLFQVSFFLQTVHNDKLQLPGLTLTVIDIDSGTSKFDLNLVMERTTEGMTGSFEYRTDLFDATTVDRMIGHFKMLLSSITRTPDERISRLDLLPEEELRQVVIEWNQTGRKFGEPDCLHEMFEEQTRERGEETAVVFEEMKLSYAELNARANQLAWMLRDRGVGPEVLVAICLERSIEMVVALLGVLKAGGAYVPLDPDYPNDRLAYILEDSGAKILVTAEEGRLQEKVEWDGPVIYIDREWHRNGGYGGQNLAVGVDADNLCYVIYTSGSTGKPKGAMLTHGGIRNRLLWGIKDYSLGPCDAVLNKTPLSFDVSVWEIFAPLCSGAKLVLARGGGQQDSGYLVKLIQQQNVTHIDFVPSMLQFFLQENAVGDCRCIKRVTAAGEALTRELVDRYHSVLNGEIYNLYGPTETSLAVTFWNCDPDSDRRVIPIGTPMCNTGLYILDRMGRPVPIGVPGEIFIGGIPPGRGYHKRPDLTAVSFIPDPFSGTPGGRIYRTGDLGRYREDGVIEFLGRIDNQVKVRGYRIELGEVEAFLGGHQKVREAVVVVREGEGGEKKLVGYVVKKDEEESPAEWELRKYMREVVPEYMVPSDFVVLDEMPLTVNGKADRAALPAPAGTRPEMEHGYVAPRDDTEEQLAAIWRNVLGVNEVGVTDSFFDLGGHSMLAIKLLAKVEEALGASLSLSTLFAEPTIEGFSRAMAEAGNDVADPLIVPISVEGNQPPLFCIHPVGGQVFSYKNIAEALAPDQPVFGIQSRAMRDSAPEHDTIAEMAETYTAAIRRQQPDGPYRLAGWSMGGVIALSVASALERQGQRVEFIGLIDSYLPTKENVEPEDPLSSLAIALGGNVAQSFLSLTPDEQRALTEELSALSLDQRLERAMSWARERSLLSTDVSVELLQRQVSLSEKHARMFKSHDIPLVEAPLCIWWAGKNIRVEGPSTDWAKHTSGGVRSESIDADHFSILIPPGSQLLASRIKEHLQIPGS